MNGRTAHLLAEALRRFSPDGASALEDLREVPASRRRGAPGSRQGRHARFARATCSGAAAALMLAGDEPELANLVFDPDFVRLRPGCAGMHTSFSYLAERFGRPPEQSLIRLWDRIVPRFVVLCGNIDALDLDGLLSIHTILSTLNIGPILYPRLFQSAFRDLWKSMARGGLLENIYVRLWLSMTGSYVGCPEHHVDLLMDPNVRTLDVADALTYSRQDRGRDALDHCAQLVRGEPIRADVARRVMNETPRSTWLRLGEYIRACSRMPSLFDNEGMLLMLLGWVESMARAGMFLVGHDGSDREAAALVASLRKIEAVHVLEKSRFWRILDKTPDGPVRCRLLKLWNEGTSACALPP